MRHGPQRLTPVDDAVRVVDDDLARLFFAEIREFRHHFVRRPQIQRQRPVGVGHLLGGKQDVAEDLVLRVEEVHVAGGDDGLAELLAEPDDGAVEAAQLLLILGKTLVEHEAVVADGLDLEEVIERRDALELRPALVVQDGLEQLARLAGRADDEPLAPLQDLRLRHNRHAAEVFEIAVGDQPVEIAQADGVFGEDDDVSRAAVHDLAAGAQLLHARVDGLQMVDALLLQHFEKAHEQIPAGDGVVGGAVVVEIGQTQRVRDDVELVFAELRHQILRQDERIDIRRLEHDAEALARCRHEADIKIGVVRAQRPAADIVEKLRDRLGDIRLPGEHLVGDAGEVDDLQLQRPVRVDEHLEGAEHLLALHDGRADLDDRVVQRRKAGRLEVEGDVFLVEGEVSVAVDGNAVVDVVDVVALAAVEDLDVLIRPGDLGLARGLHRVGEGLGPAVVGDGDGAVAPAGRTLDGRAGIGQRVHGRHRGMQMQLHALFGVGIAALGRLDLLHGGRLQDHFVVVAVKAHLALHAQPHAGLHVVDDGLGLGSLHKLIDADGAGVVRHVEADDPRPALFELPVLHGEDLALDDHTEHIEIELVHPHRPARKRPPVEQRARRLLRRRRAAGGSCGRSRAGGLCGGLDGRGVFEGLCPDAGCLLKQGLALEIAVRLDFDLLRHAEALAQELLALFGVLEDGILAVGAQMDGHGVILDRILRPGQNGGRGRERADEHLRQIAEVHMRQLFFRITHRKLQRLQAVGLFYGPAERLELLFREILLRLRVEADGARIPVELGVDDGEALERLRQLLRRLKAWEQRGEKYFTHSFTTSLCTLTAWAAVRRRGAF